MWSTGSHSWIAGDPRRRAREVVDVEDPNDSYFRFQIRAVPAPARPERCVSGVLRPPSPKDLPLFPKTNELVFDESNAHVRTVLFHTTMAKTTDITRASFCSICCQSSRNADVSKSPARSVGDLPIPRHSVRSIIHMTDPGAAASSPMRRLFSATALRKTARSSASSPTSCQPFTNI